MLIKIGALKNFTNHTGKIPTLESPLNKTASPQARSFIKKRLQHRRPLAKAAKAAKPSFLQNTPDDSSFWRKTKYDLSLKVRGQFPWSRAKTGGINQNWLITNSDQVQIIKNFL